MIASAAADESVDSVVEESPFVRGFVAGEVDDEVAGREGRRAVLSVGRRQEEPRSQEIAVQSALRQHFDARSQIPGVGFVRVLRDSAAFSSSPRFRARKKVQGALLVLERQCVVVPGIGAREIVCRGGVPHALEQLRREVRVARQEDTGVVATPVLRQHNIVGVVDKAAGLEVHLQVREDGVTVDVEQPVEPRQRLFHSEKL